MTPAQHVARIVQAVRTDVALQQRELHKVELRAAAADAFEFADNRFKRVNHGREIAPFESGEGSCRKRRRLVTPPEPERPTDNDHCARVRRSAVHVPPPAPPHRRPRPVRARCACRRRPSRRAKRRRSRNRAPHAMPRGHGDTRRVPSATKTRVHRQLRFTALYVGGPRRGRRCGQEQSVSVRQHDGPHHRFGSKRYDGPWRTRKGRSSL